MEEALRQLRLRAAEVIDDQVTLAAPGHRVTIDVDSEFVDGEAPDEDSATDEASPAADPLADDQADSAADDEAADAPYIPKMGDTFVKDEDAVIILDPNEDPFTHGFVDNLIDAELGSDTIFELTIPDDDADETIIGRRVSFVVTLKKIEEVSFPALDDAFARDVSRKRGDHELDLVGLRAATQDELARSALADAESQYSQKVLQEIVDGAEIAYPPELLDVRVGELIGDFERSLAQQGIKLDDYYRLTGSAKEDLRERYRESALQSLRQTLVMREIIRAQEIVASDEDIEKRLESMVAGYGSSPEIRKVFDASGMRGNLRDELVFSQLNAVLVAIGRGQDLATAREELRARSQADLERVQARRARLRQYQEEDETSEQASSPDAPDPPPTDEDSPGA